MSWDWVGLLAVGAVGAGLFAALAAMVQKETSKVRLARAQVQQARPRRPGAREDLASRRPGMPRQLS